MMKYLLSLLFACGLFAQDHWLEKEKLPREFQLVQWMPHYFGGAVKATNVSVTLMDDLTLTNGLFAVWHLDETGTGTRYDSWGTNHLYVRATANVTDTAGMMSNAVSVTAANDAGELTNNAAGMTFNDITISFWVNTGSPVNVCFLYCGTNSTSRQFNNQCSWGLFANGLQMRFAVNNAATILNGHTFSAGTWTHHTIVYSNSAGRAWSYVGGVYVGNTACGTLGTIAPVSFAMWGKSDASIKDEICLWSRGLTPSECALLYRMKQFKDWPKRYR